ncbi:unnamed protein product [Musa textilis]
MGSIVAFPHSKAIGPYDRTAGEERLEKQKKTHKETLELIEFLACYPGHMEFYYKGRQKEKEEEVNGGAAKEHQESMKEAIEAVAKDQKSTKEAMKEPSGESTFRRWDELPLILGAQMGRPEFVRTILLVCPQAAAYLDTKGRSGLQVGYRER